MNHQWGGQSDGALITYDDHRNRDPLLPMGQQGPHHLAGSEDGKANLVLINLSTSPPRYPLDTS